MQHSYIHSLYVFLQFFRRDCYVYSKQFWTYFINYIVIYPLKLGIFFAYLQKNIYFTTHAAEHGTLLFIGSLIIPLLVIAFSVCVDLLFDIDGERFIAYQLSVLHPRLVLLQRILFAGTFTFILTLPLFPIVAFFMKGNLAVEHTSWVRFVIAVAASALCCASYNILAMCILPVKRIRIFWSRFNAPLMNLAGMWAPLVAIKAFSPLLGTIAYANPLLYMLEGMRQAALPSDQFLPFWVCIFMLCVFTCICTSMAWYFFKKRMDHV